MSISQLGLQSATNSAITVPAAGWSVGCWPAGSRSSGTTAKACCGLQKLSIARLRRRALFPPVSTALWPQCGVTFRWTRNQRTV